MVVVELYSDSMQDDVEADRREPETNILNVSPDGQDVNIGSLQP